MATYEPVIGLEIHAQLLTRSKLFCGCAARVGDPPNTNVCPVCLGLPGALPVLNRGAVELALRSAVALHCDVAATSVFARKHYFYPDLPKGYQITQYDRPLATGGWLASARNGSPRRIGLVRLHLEEDAGKSLHHGFPDSARRTYLDFNRAGVPLVEIVTRPEIHTPVDAAAFFAYLRELLMAIGVNDGNMEEGSLRCDANVSVRPAGAATLGVKTEVKNLNSFRHLQRALEFEVDRQIRILDGGGEVIAETRQWDADASRTVSMRLKEEMPDYRYFPEPDLPPLAVAPAWIDAIRAQVPELPDATRWRLERAYGLSSYEASVLTRAFRGGAEYFEAAVAAGAAPRPVAHWLLGEARRLLNAASTDDAGRLAERVAPSRLAELVRLEESGRLSGPLAKTVFARMWDTGQSAADIVSAEGLAPLDDEAALAHVVSEVLQAHPKAVADYHSGKAKAFGFLIGQVMSATAGRAEPEALNRLLRAALAAKVD